MYTKLDNNDTIKPNLNKNLSLPWTPQGEKASGNHEILKPRKKLQASPSA